MVSDHLMMLNRGKNNRKAARWDFDCWASYSCGCLIGGLKRDLIVSVFGSFDLPL